MKSPAATAPLSPHCQPTLSAPLALLPTSLSAGWAHVCHMMDCRWPAQRLGELLVCGDVCALLGLESEPRALPAPKSAPWPSVPQATHQQSLTGIQKAQEVVGRVLGAHSD